MEPVRFQDDLQQSVVKISFILVPSVLPVDRMPILL